MDFDDTSLMTFFDEPIPKSDFAYGAFGYSLVHCGTRCRLEFQANTGDMTLVLESPGNHSLIVLEDCEEIAIDGGTLEVVCARKQSVVLTKHADRLSCVGRIRGGRES